MALEFRTNHTPLVAPGGMECFARDMTVTISADVTLSAAQAKLAEFNQWLPIDGDVQSALGELVENNSTGPLRLGYGGWRDLNVAVLEPATGYPYNMRAMIDGGQARWLAPRETLETSVLFSVQEGLRSVGGVDQNGVITAGDET